MRFEAVAEALAGGTDSLAVYHEVGRSLARDGVSLAEAMEGLRHATRSVVGSDPGFEAIQAMLHAWSEATLAHLHQISCEDPLTGLASRAHIRSRIAELHRAHTATGVRYALVVLEEQHRGTERPVAVGLNRSLRLAQLAQQARTVFNGPEVIARIASDRIVVLVERDGRLNRRVALLRRMLDGGAEPGWHTALWVEGVPDNDAGAAGLLDELARD